MMIRFFREHRGGILGLLIACFASYLAWGRPLSEAYQGVRFGGYVTVMALGLFWLLAAVPLAVSVLKQGRIPRQDLYCCAALIGLAACLLWQRTPRFEVLSDELTLQNTALYMYSEREVFSANQGFWVDGKFEVTSGHLNKRPFLYPFLVSLLHTVFGYNLMHAFALNFTLSLWSLAVGYVLLRLWFRRAFLVLMALLPIAFSALYLTNGRAAGFEMLHFGFLAVYGLALTLYWRRMDARSEAFLVATTLLIAYIRYESCVLVFVTGGLLLYGAYHERQWFKSQLTILAPLFLVPLIWLFRCTMARKGAWPVAEAEGIQVFGLQYVWGNLSDALIFFYRPSWQLGGDFFLSWFGTIGAFWLILSGVRTWLGKERTESEVVRAQSVREILLWGLGFLLLFLVYSGYFWSSFLDPASRRMSLPFLWLFALGFTSFLHLSTERIPTFQRWACLLVLIGISVSSLPSYAQIDVQREANRLAKLQTWKLNWAELNNLDPQSVWWIDDDPNLWTARRSTVFTTSEARAHLLDIELHWRAKAFERLYVVQVWVLGNSGRWRQLSGIVPNAFQLSAEPEVVYELDAHFYCRVYPVVGITVDQSIYDRFMQEAESTLSKPQLDAELNLYLWQNLPR